MITVLGLGNPGAKYSHTRHNAGFDALSEIAAFYQVKLKKRCFRLYASAKTPMAELVQPLTYMNSSGDIIHWFDRNNTFIVICDNMDLACGGLRIRQGGGSNGQKGLNSIAEALGTSDFIRIYIGTGRPEQGQSVIDHVLGKESRENYKQALEEAIKCAAEATVKLIEGRTVQEVQCEYNRKGIH